MTSIAREYELRGLGKAPSMDTVKGAVAQAFADTFRDYDWTLPALPFQSLPIQPIPSAGGPT